MAMTSFVFLISTQRVSARSSKRISSGIRKAVPEVPDQQVARESAEVGRCESKAPCCVQRRVLLAGVHDPCDQRAVRCELVDVALSRRRDVIFPRCVLARVRHEDVASERLDAEWCEAFRDLRV